MILELGHAIEFGHEKKHLKRIHIIGYIYIVDYVVKFGFFKNVKNNGGLPGGYIHALCFKSNT